MPKPYTSAEIDALPPTLTFAQAARLLQWDKDVLARTVKAGSFPVRSIPKGVRLVLPKQPVLDMLAGRSEETAA